MKLLLVFMLLTFLLAVRSARRGRPARMLPLAAVTVVVSAAYYSLRVI